MAFIVRHPEVEDYFVELTLEEAAARPNGIIDLYEDGKVVLLKDHKLDLDYKFLQTVDLTLPKDANPSLPIKKIKKMQLHNFSPSRVGPKRTPMQLAMIEQFFGGDDARFLYFTQQADSAYEQVSAILGKLFPSYRLTEQSLTYRFTETLFENLHWDSFPGYADHHQIRVFCNVDDGPRIWQLSHRLYPYLEENYERLDLRRAAGDNPNEVVGIMDREVLGGMRNRCLDGFPKHHVSFEPGEIWFGDSRAISHQVYYGRRAVIYALECDNETMQDPEKRFDRRIAALHERHRVPATA